MNTSAAPRWGDNDKYFGPFTLAFGGSYRPFAIVLSSADDDGRHCRLRFSACGLTALVALPDWVLRPERKRVVPDWDSATILRLGRNWYWDITPRELGFTLSEGHLSVAYGRQSHDSRTEQRWGWFLPWTQWRHVRHSLYALDGALFAHLPERNWRLGAANRAAYDVLSEACPTARFAFRDYDGEDLTVTTKIEEREWLLGKGWFKWLSLFAKPKVRRSLDLRFSGETGRRKGSWKGGTVGHSIDLRSGELHQSGFDRYCAEHHMTFVGPVAALSSVAAQVVNDGPGSAQTAEIADLKRRLSLSKEHLPTEKPRGPDTSGDGGDWRKHPECP